MKHGLETLERELSKAHWRNDMNAFLKTVKHLIITKFQRNHL